MSPHVLRTVFRNAAKIMVIAAVVAAPLLGEEPAGADPGNGKGSPPPSKSGQKSVCGPPAAEHARCHAHVVTQEGTATPLATTGYQYGYNPGDLRAAYLLPASGGAGHTIAIVDAFDDPKAEADLNAYRSRFGLGPCTTANRCFRKVNQTGGTSYPAADVNWAQEISLDLDMAAAICPSCKILLVEATTPSFTAFGTAVNTAVRLGATEVSNSYGSNQELSNETTYDTYYNHPGVMITASSGDAGYDQFGFPAASRYVTAVGGTRLYRSSASRGWSESVWSGGGSGCSRYETKPSWQMDTGCAKRMVADIAAVADPSTGVAVYDSYGSSGGANWYVVGGTSASAPIIAGVYALAGNGRSLTYGSYPYSHRSSLYDPTSGHNGSCSPAYFCTARSGYDGPTGVGTPKGTGAF
jgi:subtilase family serine protease